MESIWLSLKQLHLMLLGFGLMFGLFSGREVLVRVIKMAVLSGVFIYGGAAIQAAWAGLSFGSRLLILGVGLPVATVTLLARLPFGREVLASILGNAASDGLRSPKENLCSPTPSQRPSMPHTYRSLTTYPALSGRASRPAP